MQMGIHIVEILGQCLWDILERRYLSTCTALLENASENNYTAKSKSAHNKFIM